MEGRTGAHVETTGALGLSRDRRSCMRTDDEAEQAGRGNKNTLTGGHRPREVVDPDMIVISNWSERG